MFQESLLTLFLFHCLWAKLVWKMVAGRTWCKVCSPFGQVMDSDYITLRLASCNIWVTDGSSGKVGQVPLCTGEMESVLLNIFSFTDTFTFILSFASSNFWLLSCNLATRLTTSCYILQLKGIVIVMKDIWDHWSVSLQDTKNYYLNSKFDRVILAFKPSIRLSYVGSLSQCCVLYVISVQVWNLKFYRTPNCNTFAESQIGQLYCMKNYLSYVHCICFQWLVLCAASNVPQQ